MEPLPIISTIPTILGVTIVVFMFLRLIPGDPAVAMLGEHATEENVARVRELLEGVAAERKPTSRLSCQIDVTAALDGITVHMPDRQS